MNDSIDINKLNKTFESRVRLGIMSILSVNDNIDFNAMKKHLGVTDGNLASHLFALEKSEYISVEKSFSGRKPRTVYTITKQGRAAFAEHLSFLEQLIHKAK